MSGKNLYDVLGVAPTATDEQIRQAYLVRMKVMHPDRFDQATQAKEWKLANSLLEELNGAYATLRDPKLRREYDVKIKFASMPKQNAPNSANTSARPSTAKSDWSTQAPRTQTRPGTTPPVSPRAAGPKSVKPSQQPRRQQTGLLAALALLALVALFGLALNASRSGWLHFTAIFALPAPAPAPVMPPTPAPVIPDYDEQAFPEDGTIYGYSGDGDLANEVRPGIALFTVHTVSDDKFFVKMIDAATNRPVLGFCASPNATVTVKVPLGSYLIRYATGKTWYGLAHLFGPATQYGQLKRKVDFAANGPASPMNTITLYSVPDSNAGTRQIASSDF